MLNMVAPKSHKNVKCNSLGLSLAIVPLPSRGNFLHYYFQIVHNISHKMQFVSPLSVAALAFNITLRTLPRKITLNFLDNASNMTYSHFFKSGTGLRTFLITQLHNFSIYFIDVLSFCCCI